ncbi:MAG: hypothetical protein AAGF55_16905 [Pseudomonadota bacterium]
MLDPSAWVIDAPEIGSTDALHLQFDRLMDQGASERPITVAGSNGGTKPL